MESALEIMLPCLSGLLLPFTALNTFIISVQNTRQHPSLRIYLSILVLDMIIIFGGMSLFTHLKTKPDHYTEHDSDSSLGWFQNTLWISFYCSGPLFFGLALMRCLSIKTHLQINESTVSRQIQTVPW